MRVVKKEKKLVEVTVSNEYFCDKCNEKIGNYGFDAFDFELTHRTGTSYPECGSGIDQEVHLCQDCAKGLFELLEDNGYRINEEKWDR